MGDNRTQTRRKRVFVSDVDRYSSKHIAEFLSTRVVGDEDEPTSSDAEAAFQVVGTVSSPPEREKRSFLLEQYASPSRQQLLQHLLACDVVVFNVSETNAQQQVEEASWAITALHAEVENFKSRKMFILVSTVMTRAVARRQHPDEDDLLTEEEFKERRPHPSFKSHEHLEKLVLRLGRSKKSKLTCYVVASGLQYGKGENLFHYFFKVSWLMQCPKVPIFGQGTNHLPMIHVYDLAGVIQNIIKVRPASKYILAVDGSKNTLEAVVKMISDKLGPGEVARLPKEEALTMNAFQPDELELLSVNLHLDAFTINDAFNLQWNSEGMVENMENIIEEYRDTRQLLPIRICIVGPPAVGKTTVAKKLCSYYQIHYINIHEVVEETITQLKETVNTVDPEASSKAVAADARTQLDAINKSMETNAGRLNEHLLFEVLQEKLKSMPCRNQGFVLDGFPQTYQQAKAFFHDEDAEIQDSKYKTRVCNKNITPDHVIVLEASDDFLRTRVQGLPEREAEELRFTQDEFEPRLVRYRQSAAAEETLLDYFDELEIHPECIEVDTDPEYKDVMRTITEMVGTPKNYGRSPEELEAENRQKEEERKQEVAAAAAEKKRRNEAALAEMVAQYEEWNLSEVRRQECELQEAQAMPLRNYLMKNVMPRLSEAMLECSRIKPDDPVNFLAEYLLRNNQESTPGGRD